MSEDHNEAVTPDVITDLALTGTVGVGDLRSRMDRMSQMIEMKRDFLKSNLREGIQNDFAVIPYCGDKKVLLKPGAEKLLEWFGYYPSFIIVSEKEDWDRGIFAYVYRCTIKQRGSNIVIADCEGDASTMESKYRFEWKYDYQLPKGIDKESLKTRKVGEQKSVQYQVEIDNPADKRNTVRKMAQKRALLGATVLATASSDLFTTDVDPEEPDHPTVIFKETDDHPAQPTSEQPAESSHQSAAKPADAKDYGNPISEAQGKRLYAIRKKANVSDEDFAAWLKKKYGYKSDREIGWKVYNEICEAVEKWNPRAL